MAGLLEMVAIVIKENGSHILAYMPKPGNTFYSTIQEAIMVIGSPETSVMNFEKKTQTQPSLRF